MSILVVCTGNIIRSAFIAGLMRSALVSAGVTGFTIESAGTSAVVGSAAATRVRHLARAYDVDLDAHRGRQLTESMLAGATTILGAASEHRQSVVRMAPAKIRSTFTVRELARLSSALDQNALSANPVARWGQIGAFAAEARRRNAYPALPSDDDIADPISAGDDVWRAFERDAVVSTNALLELLLTRTAEPMRSTTLRSF